MKQEVCTCVCPYESQQSSIKSPHRQDNLKVIQPSGTYTQECFQIYFRPCVVWKLLLSVHLPCHQDPV